MNLTHSLETEDLSAIPSENFAQLEVEEEEQSTPAEPIIQEIVDVSDKVIVINNDDVSPQPEPKPEQQEVDSRGIGKRQSGPFVFSVGSLVQHFAFLFR